MNSSLNVPSTTSNSSQMNGSFILTDKNASVGVPSSSAPSDLLPKIPQVLEQRLPDLLPTYRPPLMPVNNRPGQSMQQQNSTSVIMDSSLDARNPTPSPPSQMSYQMMHSPNVTSNSSLNALNPTPPSQFNYSVMHSPNFASNSPPMSSDMHSLTLFPPLVSSPQLLHAEPTSFTDLLNGTDYSQNSKDPPPYSTAVLNNQSEVTYTTLNSVPPYHLYQNPIPDIITSSLSEQTARAFMQSTQVLEGKMNDPSVDEGLGTSPETSPGQQSQNSPGIVYGDDSMNGVYTSSMPVPPLFEHIQPQCGQGQVCGKCGRFLLLSNGQYKCNSCEEEKLPKVAKPRKKKTENATASKKNAKSICSNCQTVVTSLWRRDPNGFSLCNACGLYLKLHKVNRPISMRKDKIQKRNRKPRNTEAKIPKLETPSIPSEACPAFATVNNPTFATVNNPGIPYSVPTTSSSVPSTLYFGPPLTPAVSSSSYQLPFQVRNLNPTIMLHNPLVIGENSNQNTYTQFNMLSL